MTRSGSRPAPPTRDALTVSVSGTTLSLTAKQHTIVSVRVIANDGKSQVQDDIHGDHQQRADGCQRGGGRRAVAGRFRRLRYDMNNVFSDADSDYFTFGVTTSDSSVATVSWSDGTLTVTGISAWATATITMTVRATTTAGSATDAFAVTVDGAGRRELPTPGQQRPE